MTLPRSRAASAASLWPARLDLLQALSGLALALFMWLHRGFVSAILISADFAWSVARFFEGYFFLPRPQAWLVSAFVAAIAALSAPTGMAVRLAEAAGVTLVGFARGHRHSVYTHPQRMH